MLKQFLYRVQINPFHWFAIDRTHWRLPNPVNRKHGRLNRLVAIAELKACVHLDLSAATFEPALVRPKLYSNVTDFHGDHFGAIGENVQVNGRVIIGGSNQNRADQSW